MENRDDSPGRLSQLALTPERTPPAPHGSRRLIAFLRLALPLAALALVVVVLAWPRMDKVPALMEEGKGEKQAVSNELIHPRFESVDSGGRPFVVTAGRAVQSGSDPDAVLLDDPRGDSTGSKGETLTATARRGTYLQKTRRLELEGDVTLSHGGGYTIGSDRLTIDAAGRNAWTNTPVKGGGPAGTIEASGVKVSGNEGLLVFTGPATLVLKGSTKEGSPP